MEVLNRNQIWKVPFIPDRGNTAVLNASLITLDFGRIIIERHPSGQIRIKIGSGTGKTFPQEVYLNDNIIVRTDPTTKAFGDIPAGTVLGDKSVIEAFNAAYWAYQDVVLNSIGLSPNEIEIGFELSGNLTVTPNISNSGNLITGDAATIDSTLVANGAFDPRSPLVIAIIAATNNTPTDVPVTVEITGNETETSQKIANVSWLPRIIHLSNASDSITDAPTILAAVGGDTILSNTRQGLKDFTGGYSHFYFPSFVNITGIGFADIDLNTGLPLFNYAVEQQNDVVINNGQISVTLKYFRSVNTFGGATRCEVT